MYILIISCILNIVLLLHCFVYFNKRKTMNNNLKHHLDFQYNLCPRLWSCLHYKENDIYKNSFYSQFEEDKLFYKTYFKNKLNGIYVELGALDGLLASNTYFFENYLGWSGILIEGGYNNCMKLINNQSKRPRSEIICSAICKDKYAEYKEFLAVGGVTKDLPINWFGLDKKQSITVRCSNISSILHIHKISHIDFFSLDVEGAELNVLETFDFSVLVNYWCIEFNSDKDYKNQRVRKLLIENGYTRCSLKLTHNNECWEDKNYVNKVTQLIEEENHFRSNFGVKCNQ